MIRFPLILIVLPLLALAEVADNDPAPDLSQSHAAEESTKEQTTADNAPENAQIPPVQIPDGKESNEGGSEAGNSQSAIGFNVAAFSADPGIAEETLIQQVRIADYTEEMARQSKKQVWVNGAVAGFIFVTLLFTAWTARAAQRSAKAAEEVIKQNRAWITPIANYVPIRADTSSPIGLVFSIAIRNSGRTPANHIRISAIIQEAGSEVHVLRAQQFWYGFLGADDNVEFGIDTLIWKGYERAVTSGGSVSIICKIEYHTVYKGVLGSTAFEYEIASTEHAIGPEWSKVENKPDTSFRVVGNRCRAS